MSTPVAGMIDIPFFHMATATKTMRSIARIVFMTSNTKIISNRPAVFWQNACSRMMQLMFKSRHQLKILFTIIKTIVIQMVHDFAGIQFASQFLFHDYSMFISPSTAIRNFYKPIKNRSTFSFLAASDWINFKMTQSLASDHSCYRFFIPMWLWWFSQTKAILFAHRLTSFAAHLIALDIAFFERSLIGFC